MTRTRCAAPTKAGHPCRRWPEEDEDRCPVHQDIPVVEDPTGATEELRRRQENPTDEDDNRCGAPTDDGTPCRKFPMAGSAYCSEHAGLERTEAELRSWREGNLKHGFFVSGFLDDQERQLFQEILEGRRDFGELKAHIVAAHVIRLNRMMRWEAEHQEVSRFTNRAFAELRRAIDSLEADDLRVEHSYNIGEVHDQVMSLLKDDPELLCRVVPEEAEEAVREAF